MKQRRNPDAVTKERAEQLLRTDIGKALARHPARYYLGVFELYRHFLTDSETTHDRRFLTVAVTQEPLILAAMDLLQRKRPVLA